MAYVWIRTSHTCIFRPRITNLKFKSVRELTSVRDLTHARDHTSAREFKSAWEFKSATDLKCCTDLKSATDHTDHTSAKASKALATELSPLRPTPAELTLLGPSRSQSAPSKNAKSRHLWISRVRRPQTAGQPQCPQKRCSVFSRPSQGFRSRVSQRGLALPGQTAKPFSQ